MVMDAVGDFYPPAAWAMGVDPDRLLIVRPGTLENCGWAMDLCLRCSAVEIVVATLPHLETTLSRRLQLAAESGGSVGLILRPAQRCEKTFAAIRMLIEPIPPPLSPLRRSVAASLSSPSCLPSSPTSLRPFVPSSLPPPPSLPPPSHRITLIKVREGNPIANILVNLSNGEMDDETRAVSIHAGFADPAVGANSQRVSA